MGSVALNVPAWIMIFTDASIYSSAMTTRDYLFLAVSACCLAGCSSISAAMARGAAPEAVKSGLESAAEPESRRQIQTILADTPVKAAIVAIDKEAVRAILSVLAEAESKKPLRKIAREITAAVGEELSSPTPEATTRKDAAANEAVRAAVRAAIDELRRELPSLIRDVASNREVQKSLKPLGKEAGGGAAKGAVESLTGGSSE